MVDKVHTTAKVNGPLFEGIMWAGVVVTACFIAFRLWVRRTTMNKFLWDDGLVVLGWVSLALNAALQQTQVNHIYGLFAMQAHPTMPTLEWMKGQTELLHHVAAFNILFYTGLWAVKISFMIFFRYIEGGVTNHRYWWWFVLVISIASWIVCIADIQWECTIINVQENIIKYFSCGTGDKVRFQQTTFRVNCALDIATDIMVLSVPVALLWNRRIPLKKKIFLIGMFSMTVLIMAVSLIRVTVVSSKDVPSDMTWLYFWSNIELMIALIVSSLASFRQLYMSKQPATAGMPADSGNKGSLPSFVRKVTRSKIEDSMELKSTTSLEHTEV